MWSSRRRKDSRLEGACFPRCGFVPAQDLIRTIFNPQWELLLHVSGRWSACWLVVTEPGGEKALLRFSRRWPGFLVETRQEMWFHFVSREPVPAPRFLKAVTSWSASWARPTAGHSGGTHQSFSMRSSCDPVGVSFFSLVCLISFGPSSSDTMLIHTCAPITFTPSLLLGGILSTPRNRSCLNLHTPGGSK